MVRAESGSSTESVTRTIERERILAKDQLSRQSEYYPQSHLNLHRPSIGPLITARLTAAASVKITIQWFNGSARIFNVYTFPGAVASSSAPQPPMYDTLSPLSPPLKSGGMVIIDIFFLPLFNARCKVTSTSTSNRYITRIPLSALVWSYPSRIRADRTAWCTPITLPREGHLPSHLLQAGGVIRRSLVPPQLRIAYKGHGEELSMRAGDVETVTRIWQRSRDIWGDGVGTWIEAATPHVELKPRLWPIRARGDSSLRWDFHLSKHDTQVSPFLCPSLWTTNRKCRAREEREMALVWRDFW